VVIATLFGRRSEQISRLYFADLLGAGIACAIVVSLLGSIGPPATVFLAGLVLALVGVRIAARRRSRALPAGIVVAVLLATPIIAPGLLPDPRTDATKGDVTGDSIVYSSWSPLFRVDVAQLSPDVRVLFHDGLLGSGILRWDGEKASLAEKGFDRDPRAFPFAVTGTSPKDVLIIGAAGGHEVLASLSFDAEHIDAIELNPVTYSLVTDKMADYGGHLAENPHVNFVKGEGRSYLARKDTHYNLIWYPAPDSYSASNAANAGAFVLSESYLYTREAIRDSLEHLTPNGVIAAQFGEYDYAGKPNRTTRYVGTARDALRKLGVDDPTRHIVVITTPTAGPAVLSTILVKRTPFTDAEIARTVDVVGNVPGSTVRYAPGVPYDEGPVSDVVTVGNEGLDRWYDSYPYDVRPITDNGPFFWNFAPFGDVVKNFGDPIDRRDPEDSVGERVLVLLLVISIVFAAAFLLLPFVVVRDVWGRLPRKGRSAIYFAALGFGFMFFEITLIQRLTLFLGYPTYSLTVTLASILVFTGLGALLSGRLRAPTSRVTGYLAGAIALLTVFYQFALPSITDGFLGWPLALRILVAFVVLAPLGLCLGMFMPLGIRAVAALTTHEREYVAWGWAVNGFASVIGSVLTTILAISFGFRTVLFLALVLYLIALVALRGLLVAARGTAPAPA
jgi:hypothetical protein